MKALKIIMVVVTSLLLFSTVVCGLWMRYSGKEVDDSSRLFHMVVGLAGVAATAVTLVLLARRG